MHLGATSSSALATLVEAQSATEAVPPPSLPSFLSLWHSHGHKANLLLTDLDGAGHARAAAEAAPECVKRRKNSKKEAEKRRKK